MFQKKGISLIYNTNGSMVIINILGKLYEIVNIPIVVEVISFIIGKIDTKFSKRIEKNGVKKIDSIILSSDRQFRSIPMHNEISDAVDFIINDSSTKLSLLKIEIDQKYNDYKRFSKNINQFIILISNFAGCISFLLNLLLSPAIRDNALLIFFIIYFPLLFAYLFAEILLFFKKIRFNKLINSCDSKINSVTLQINKAISQIYGSQFEMEIIEEIRPKLKKTGYKFSGKQYKSYLANIGIDISMYDIADSYLYLIFSDKTVSNENKEIIKRNLLDKKIWGLKKEYATILWEKYDNKTELSVPKVKIYLCN